MDTESAMGLSPPGPGLWAAFTLFVLSVTLLIQLFRTKLSSFFAKRGELSLTAQLQEKPQVQVTAKESVVSQSQHRNNQKQSKKKQQQQQQQHNNHHNHQQHNSKNSKSGFQHQLLAASLMGHTDKILDMDCSADGKYLVSCAEDGLPSDVQREVLASTMKEDKENLSPPESPDGSSPGSPEGVRRNVRRRRRPRTSQFSCSPPEVEPVPIPIQPSPPPLQRFTDLKMDEHTLASMLSYYLLAPDQLASLGFPVESDHYPARAVIYTLEFPFARKFDSRSKEFTANGRQTNSTVGEDSGRGSGSSSPRSGDSDPDSEEDLTKYGVRRKCARCMRGFFMAPNGEYLTRERCRHHWGRLRRGNSPTVYSCCGQSAESLGCSRAPLHVWSGIDVGLNGPLEGFIRTHPPTNRAKHRVLALDCEMCYTAAGLQVARVEMVAADGRRIYGSYILPDAPVIDYNTRFSGITASDMKNATKSLREVQQDLMEMIDASTILVGHGLENDLRALRILHGRIVDTSISFPHVRGFPFRTSLRELASRHLCMSVQEAHHCPLEDARASLDLMLWRIQRDFNRLPA